MADITEIQSLIQAICDTLIEAEQHKVELSFNDFGEPYSGLSGKSAEDFGEGCQYITYMNVYQNQIIDTTDVGLVKINETEQQSVVSYGDILFTLSSETPNEVGMGAVYLGDTYPLYLNSFCFGVRIIDEKVEYLDSNGNLITVSIIDYSRNNLRRLYPYYEEFRKVWLAQKKKHELLDQLLEDGGFIDYVKDTIPEAHVDDYDVLSYIGYEREPLTKEERIDHILVSGY